MAIITSVSSQCLQSSHTCIGADEHTFFKAVGRRCDFDSPSARCLSCECYEY